MVCDWVPPAPNIVGGEKVQLSLEPCDTIDVTDDEPCPDHTIPASHMHTAPPRQVGPKYPIANNKRKRMARELVQPQEGVSRNFTSQSLAIMIDPVCAVGLASAVVTLLDTGTKVVKRLKELSEAGDIPEVFRDIKTRLPLLSNYVLYTQSRTDTLSPEAGEEVTEVVKRCLEQVRQLDELLKRMAVSDGESSFRRSIRAFISVSEEGRVQRIATALKDNVQVLSTFLSVPPVEKERPKVDRWLSEPLPSYASVAGLFLVPFSRDEQFVGRQKLLEMIALSFKAQSRVAISGIGGIGKSQIAIEYCYRYKESRPEAHVLWVYGGNIARFYQGYKRIAQRLEIPGWDDPEKSILELVENWLSNTTGSYLLVIDNADNIEHWWPGKYKTGGSLDDPLKNLSKYIPDGSDNIQVLITTRDTRVATRLVRKGEPIAVEPMSSEEAKVLFLSKLGREAADSEKAEIQQLLKELDNLPLAVSQAAAFIEESKISIKKYTDTLQGEGAEEYLNEELNDSRRDEESVNCVFRTWKISYEQIKRQQVRAAELLCLLAMLDRQSVSRSLLKVPEVTTSLNVLMSFNLVTARAGAESFQIHRLVQRFVQHSLQRDNEMQKWQEIALACVANDYPTEIGVAEWPVCDAFAPHVHVLTAYNYQTKKARLDLAHLLCWAADFDIERGMYKQALQRASESLRIFRELAFERDQRLAAATWLCGRLRYYQAQRSSDLDVAAELLQEALRISTYPSLNFAESAFELAHLNYDRGNKDACLEMGKASFECWKELEGPDSVRTLDNMHDYALELAMLGHEERGIAIWEEILERCPASNASKETKTVYTYRSMASIAEFRGDAAMAEILYSQLITLGEAMYHSEHVHLFDYRLSHAEQMMRQGKLREAAQLSRAILASCKNNFEWQITSCSLQTVAECCRLKACYSFEEGFRLSALELHEKKLGRHHRDTINAQEALAECYLNSAKFAEAKELYETVISWREVELGRTHADTLRAIECLGVCHAHHGHHAEAEVAFIEVIGRQSDPPGRLLDNLYSSLWNQGKWKTLESWSKQACSPSAQYSLTTALDQQGKRAEALELRARSLTMGAPNAAVPPVLKCPPVRDDRRFARMIHPRTWSA
ncbi:MAG: hypothetical protein Q9228_001120 [Teloschistes exilis]